MLKEKLKAVPQSSGCYLMKDKNNVVIYVGKAKNLKHRLSSYFNNKHYGKTKALIDNIYTFEYVVTTNESEALILELNLIKKYNPKYNILFRDDKTYPYIALTEEEYPRLLIIRDHANKKMNAKLFGPYPNVLAAKKTIKMLNRMYPLRKCNTLGKKECLYYHIGECAGYCIHHVDPKMITKMKKEIIAFLKGNDNILIDKIKKDMFEASRKLNFERAQEMKLLLEDINLTLRKQVVALNDYIDRDIFGYYTNKEYIAIQVFYLRGGKLVERESIIHLLLDDEIETLTYYICSFYDQNNIKPKEILVPSKINIKLLEDILKIKVVNPKKGNKKQLLDLACNNAKLALEDKIKMIEREEQINIESCKQLASLLNLKKVNRIEFFDNSHLFGTFAVSSMIVFIDGKPNKNEYRKYKITSNYHDDYHLMKEVIYRRYFRVLKDKLTFPDLIIVDGGKLQIKAAEEVLSGFKLNIPVCGLRKNRKHLTDALIFNDKIIEIEKDSYLFHLLERIQTEGHRFTINYHKKVRSKGVLESILDHIKGIGPTRKIKLLKQFGSLEKIKTASEEELKYILPKKVIKTLKEYLDTIN